MEFKKSFRTLWFQVFLNGTFSVETLIFLSAFIISYSVCRKLDHPKESFIIEYYLSRMLRYIVVLSIIIMMVIILPDFGTGPMFKVIEIHFNISSLTYMILTYFR